MPDFTIVRCKNRSSQPISCFFDGVQTTLEAHEERHMLAAVAEKMKSQNPVMGTEDPMTTDARSGEFLAGIVEWGDDCSPIEQSDKLERLDADLIPARKGFTRTVQGARIPRRRSAVVTNPPVDATGVRFVDGSGDV